MTLHTGIPVQAPSSINLSQNLMSLFSVSIGYDCYQDQVYALIWDPQTDKLMEAKKVKMRSIYQPAPVPAITYGNGTLDVSYAINLMTNYSFLDEPIILTIPKNKEIEVGLVGSFFNPADGDSDGICDQKLGGVANNSTAMIGHSLVSSAAIQSGSIPISIDVMHTNPTANYNLGAYPNRYRDWTEIDEKFNYSGNYGTLKTISFLGDHVNDLKITIHLDNGYAGTKYYIPHFFPMVAEFDFTASSPSGCTSGYPCNGHYQAIVNGSGSTISPILMPLVTPTPAGNVYTTFPGNPSFITTTY